MFPSTFSFKRKYEEKMQKFPYDKYLQPMQIKVKLKRILIFKLEKNNNSNKKNTNNKNKDNNIAKKKEKAYLLCNLSKQWVKDTPSI